MIRRAKETASLNTLRWDSKNDSNKGLAVVCGIYFAEPVTILVFKIFYEVFGGGTRLAMPKTICVPDSSSLKPVSGATEGVLDQGVSG